jgi:hypothetical protein
MDGRIAWWLGLLLGVCVLAATARAQSLSSEGFDPLGDARKQGAAYEDMVEGELSLVGKQFVVQMQVAAPLPALPPGRPGSDGWTVWETACVDLDPALNLPGWPFAGNYGFDCELLVLFIADGTDYFALFADRRPVAGGGDVLIVDSRASDLVRWRVDGATIRVNVDAQLRSDLPSSFTWRFGVVEVNSIGSDCVHVIDELDNMIPWPAVDGG